MSTPTPDVVAEGDVECPCGEYVFPATVAQRWDWGGGLQVICPNCERVLESLGPTLSDRT